VWFVTRPRVRGVLAFPLTPEGKLIMVRLTYAKGWRLPGGGRGKSEGAEEAMLRELREEIGLTGHGEVRHLYDFEHEPDYRRGTTDVFLVADVRYQPRQSLEIEETGEFDPHGLPEDTTGGTREQIGYALEVMEGRS
jgi:8-oxo-dGTP pyrophosphatase MutT (NUDIX family)